MLVISETKIDASIPDSHFRVNGYRFCRSDRKAGGGGLIIYVRSDICFVRANQLNGLAAENLANFKTETIVIKIKLGKACVAIVGVYRPPSIPKSIWTNELSMLFEAVSMLTDTIYYAGDFNADLLDPDKPPYEGRNLLDLLDIYNLECLIDEATRKQIHPKRYSI